MRLIDAAAIRVPLAGRTKREAIAELLDLLADRDGLTRRDEILTQLLERERKKSTAIGYGAAIPHVRTEHVSETICAFGTAADREIDFSNEGEDPCGARLLFLMISPKDDAPTHLRALAKIARLIKDEARREALVAATEPAQVLDLLGDLATN